MRWPLAIVVVLWAGPLSAQSRYKKLCDEHDPKLCAQAVLEGETVPFDGQLLTIEKAIQQAQEANWCDVEKGHAVRKCEELAAGQKKLDAKLAEIDIRASKREIGVLEQSNLDLRAQAAAAGERSWLEHPLLWTVIGAVGATASLLGGAKIVKMVR